MTMPSEAHYAELIGALRDASKSFDAAEDDKAQLAVCRQALGSVMHYLRFDPEVTADNLARPLAVLRTAAYDKAQGATVALLEHQPGRAGKPTGTAREVVQGTVAYVAEMMVATGIGKDRAIVWVATELRRQGVTNEDGKPIVGKQIADWRSGCSRGKAPKDACDSFEGWRRTPGVPGGPPINELLRKAKAARTPEVVAAIQEIATTVIKSVAGSAPQSAPRQTRRAS